MPKRVGQYQHPLSSAATDFTKPRSPSGPNNQNRWEVLSKSTLPVEIPTLSIILATSGSFSKAEEDEGPIEEVSSAAFMVVNGRVLVLEELEKHINSSFDSLLKALVDLTSQDLIADFEESNPGESLPSVFGPGSD